MNEAEFTTLVIEMAKAFDWLVHHQRPGRMVDGRWRSSIQGHPGFLDLVLAKDGRAYIAELKSQQGRIRPDQKRWLAALGPQPITRTALWRPKDLDEIEEVLRGT